jgi:hypothetical protein
LEPGRAAGKSRPVGAEEAYITIYNHLINLVFRAREQANLKAKIISDNNVLEESNIQNIRTHNYYLIIGFLDLIWAF